MLPGGGAGGGAVEGTEEAAGGALTSATDSGGASGGVDTRATGSTEGARQETPERERIAWGNAYRGSGSREGGAARRRWWVMVSAAV